MLNIAINVYCTLPYYAGIMLNAINDRYAHNYAGIIGRSLLICYKVANITLKFLDKYSFGYESYVYN